MFNLEILRAIEDADGRRWRSGFQFGVEVHHIDVVALPLDPARAAASELYLYPDCLRDFCNSGRPLHEARFHVNCGVPCDIPAFMARTAATMEAYVAVLLPYEGYKSLPNWYQTVALGLPALGLAEWTVLRREGFLRQALVGGTMYAAGSVWRGIENLSTDIANSIVRWLRKPYAAAIRGLAEHRIDAKCLNRTLIGHEGGTFTHIAFRDDFSDPRDPFPRCIFNASLMLVADTIAGALPRGSVNLRFYREVLEETAHLHPDLAAPLSMLRRASEGTT